MIIKTKKFTLRPYKKWDEKSLQENINDKHIYKFTVRIPHPYKIKDARDFIKSCLKAQKNKDKSKIMLAIDVEGRVIGAVALENIKKHKAEIGYWLGKRYWNTGIMTEAVKIMTDYGFSKLKLKRVYANTFPQNKASRKVLEKNGFKLEGMLKKDELKDGKVYDTTIYAKTK